MTTDRRALTVILVCVMAAVVVGGLVVAPRLLGDDASDPRQDAEAFLAAWSDGDVDAMAARVAGGDGAFAEQFTSVTEGLDVTSATYRLRDLRQDESDELAIATFDARVEVAGVGEWAYEGSLRLRPAGSGSGEGEDDGDGWRVEWSPAVVHPDLADGQRLRTNRTWPERAPINGADGQPLVSARPGVIIGVQPSRVQDMAAVKAALQAELGIDPAAVDAAVGAQGVQPDHFVPLTTVSQERYTQVEPVIYPIPGTLFRETMLRGGPTEGYAQHVLGTTAEVTAERLDELGAPYQVGDVVGMTGLEAVFEEQLAGTPSTVVEMVDEADQVVGTLTTIEGRAPVPVNTTIDPLVQAAVETAISGVTKPAAIVVTDGGGNIRGIASRPLTEGLNRALAGAYPPGSTFKIVTADALLTTGTTPDTPVECAATTNAGGRSFRNFEGGALGTVPFGQAFAESCNTAMITASAPVDTTELVAAAERFGFNTDYSVGLTTEGGSYPEPTDATEQAAQSIGQGRITASPLHMSTVAGAVMDGTWEPPTLLVDGGAGAGQGATGPEASGTATTAPPPAGVETTGTTVTGAGAQGAAARSTTIANRDTLANLMARVVTEGSGGAAAVPGQTVYGKTGTAEYGTGDPPPTHAWFVGFTGDLAASVFIEDGGVGGRDAAPVAGTLFAALPR